MALEAQEVAVRVRLLGGSAFEKEAQGVSDSIRRIGDSNKSANLNGGLLGTLGKAGTLVTGLGAKLNKVGRGMTEVGKNLTIASAPLVYIGYKSVQAASTFQQSMTLLRTQALDSAGDVQFLTKQVMALPAAMGDPQELAKGLYPIVSSGLHGKQAMDALKAAAMGAKVGIDTVTNTSTALMGIMNTGIKGANNPMGVMSTLDAIVGSGMMKLPDLMQAMHSEIIPMAKEVGLSFQDIGTAIAAMTRQNIPAQRFANLMKLTLTKMMHPTGQALKAVQALGMTQNTLADDLKKPNGLVAALTDLFNALQKLPGGYKGNQSFGYIADLFGQSRGSANVLGLLNVLPLMAGEIGRKVRSGTPQAFQGRYDATQQTYAAKMAALRSQIDKSLITLGTTILPMLMPLLKQVTTDVGSAVKWFQHLSPHTQRFLIKMTALAVVAGPLLVVFGSLFRIVGTVLTVMGSLFSSVGALAGGEVGLGSLLGPIGLLAGAIMAAYLTIKPFHNAVNDVVSFVMGDFLHKHKTKRTGTNVLGTPKSDHSAVLVNGHWADMARPRNDPYAVWNGKTWVDMARPRNDPYAVWNGKAWVDARFPGMATGGIVRKSGMSWVGEAGPELLSLPEGARVDPLPKLTGMGARPTLNGFSTDLSGNWQVTVEAPVYLDGKMIARSVNTVNRAEANRR